MEKYRIIFYIMVILSDEFVNVALTNDKKTNGEHSHTASSSSSSKGTTRTVQLNMQQIDGKCTEIAQISGNSVSETLTFPCSNNQRGRNIVNEENKLIIGGEDGDDNGVYSDKPNSLVVVRDGKCIEKSYRQGVKPKDNKLSDKDCKKVKKSMKEGYKLAKERESNQFQSMENDLNANLQIDIPDLEINDPFQSNINSQDF